MVSALVVSVILAQGSPMMVSPQVRSATIAADDYFTSTLLGVDVECSGDAVGFTGGETLSYTRASSAYCTKASGAMVLLTTDTPRVASAGLFIEGPRTNLWTHSDALDNADWTQFSTTSNTGINGASFGGLAASMELVENSGGSGGNAFQGVTVSSTVGPFAVSTWASSVSGTQKVGFLLYCGNDPASCSCTMSDGSSCVATDDGVDRCTTVATVGTTPVRMMATFTCGTAVTSPSAGVIPGEYNVASGQAYFGGLQFEVATTTNPVSSSYIPTVATSVSRAADDAHLTPGHAMSATGCASATVTAGYVAPTSARIIAGVGATAPLYVASATTVGMDDGTTTAAVTTGALASTARAVRSGWGSGTEAVYFSASSGTDVFDGSMNAGTVYLGSQTATSNFLYGYLKSVFFGTTAAGCQD